MSFDVSHLTQIGPLIVLSETDSQNRVNSLMDSNVDPSLSLEGSDDRNLSDAMDEALGLLSGADPVYSRGRGAAAPSGF